MDGIHEFVESYFGEDADRITPLHMSVSTRKYFRVKKGNESFILTYSPDKKETLAFTRFSKHFLNLNLPVPKVFATSEDLHYYIQQDLGDQRLHEKITARVKSGLEKPLLDLYKESITNLIRLQIEGHKGLDYSVSVPRPAFDHQAVMWDMYHFKYYFLKPSGIAYDEEKLEKVFMEFATHLDRQPKNAFMLRDFQTRNIMLYEGKPYFIDFQGGREGAIQYDLASLLWESKAGLTDKDRELLMHHYLQTVKAYLPINEQDFLENYYAFSLIRILQVLGTYGLRGLVEKKAVFLQSIPLGLANLEKILLFQPSNCLPDYFRKLLEKVSALKENYRELPEAYEGLTLTIFSFSYRKPLPDDITGNGGGFVYDCRLFSNPGRDERFTKLTGLDAGVIDYLDDCADVVAFFDSVKEQLMKAIFSYKKREYRNLMVSFGCTGGQHRSVYMASKIADWCRSLPGIKTIEIHRELNIEK